MTVAIETISLLIDIRTQEFAKAYEQGLSCSLFGDRENNSPVQDSYLVTNLKQDAAHGFFDGQHENDLPHIGFYIGVIHGGVLSPQTGELRPDVTTLVRLRDTQITRGYRAGREWFFNEAEPHEQRRTDADFLERLNESITDMLSFHDSDETWNFSIGCVLGELSGQLFPQTPQEREHWIEATLRLEAHLNQCQQAQEGTTEPIPVLTLQEA